MDRIAQLIIRYKVLHVAFWTFSFFSELHLTQHMRPTEEYATLNWIDSSTNLFFQILCAYSILICFLNKFYERGKYLTFLSLFTSTAFFYSALNALMQITYLPLVTSEPMEVGSANLFIGWFAKFVDMLIASGLITSVVITYRYFHRERKRELREKQRLESELIQLKSQLNPDFVYEALQSIYAEIQLDPERGSAAIQEFSELIKYQLHQAQPTIQVSKDIAFISHYVAIQKIIHTEKIQISFHCNLGEKDHIIPPFLIFPLVENAFRHGSKTLQENTITIDISSDNQSIQVLISNTFNRQDDLLHDPMLGRGIQRVKQRLELHFADKHILEVRHTEDFYAVEFQLQF
jgi:two-component system, LytTR family, sensor kinase